MDFNFAPLALRRNFAMLGFIFKCVKGLAPKRCEALFERMDSQTNRSTRSGDHRHSLQLVDPIGFCPTEILKRSVHGSVFIWNGLPKELVAQPNVKAFHKQLTARAKNALKNGMSITDVCDLRWIRFRYGTEIHFG